MRISVDELVGKRLNWAVQQAEIKTLVHPDLGLLLHYIERGNPVKEYSLRWSMAGPIMFREKIYFCPQADDTWSGHCNEVIAANSFNCQTPMVAAMRCYVKKVLGHIIELPEELK